MCNYCSFGVDARIGLGFDKNRTSSRYMNKFIYGWEGFKKFFIKTLPMQNIVENVGFANFAQIDTAI